MKDDWRVLDPALPPEPVPGASLEKAAAEALAAGNDLENMRFFGGRALRPVREKSGRAGMRV